MSNLICPDVSMDGLDRLLFIKSGDTFAESILVMWSFLQLLELDASVYWFLYSLSPSQPRGPESRPSGCDGD